MWRAAGINPSNLTRCEICHYRYKFFGQGSTLRLQTWFLGAALGEIIAFLVIAAAVGWALKTSDLLDEYDLGRLYFMKPERKRDYFLAGCLFIFWCIGVLATLKALARMIWGVSAREHSRRLLVQKTTSSPSSFVQTGMHRRQRNWDCLDCGDLYLCLWLQASDASPPINCCEGCCVYCTTCFDGFDGTCTGCSGNADLSGVGCDDECGGGIAAAIIFVVVVVIALIGVFVFFGAIFLNVWYAFSRHYTDIREDTAERFVVRPYEGDPDEQMEEGVAIGNARHTLVHSEPAPVQELMVTSL